MPPGSTYYIATGSVVAGLSAAILIMALVVGVSGPRVRQVVVQNSEHGEISGTDQVLTLVFDRTVRASHEHPLKSQISIEPHADYTLSHNKGQISVSFDENLQSNKHYTLSVGPDLIDESGHRMKSVYHYEFKTAEPTFTYLERNYAPNALDKIIEVSPSSQKSKVLYFAPQIESFVRNDDYMTVVLPETKYKSDLRTVDLQSGKVQEVSVPGAVRISDISFSPLGDQFAFVTEVVAGPGAGASFAKGYNGKLYIYDIGDDDLKAVDTLSDDGDVQSVQYSNDGQVLLYQTFEGTYYLTSAVGSSTPTPLGSYDASGGFNRTNTKILFKTEDAASAIYDAKTKRLEKLPYAGTTNSNSVPTFLHNSDALVYRKSLTDADQGESDSRVYIRDASGRLKERVDSPPHTSFYDDPVASYDDRYILIESTSNYSLDYYPANAQPTDARLLLYDRATNKVIEEVRGIDPVWNP